jgi:hypothetical protein
MEVFASIIYYPVGWLYLWIRYRNKNKVKTILKEKYDNSYYTAGALLMWKTFGILLFMLIVLFLLTVIGRTIYDLVT